MCFLNCQPSSSLSGCHWELQSIFWAQYHSRECSLLYNRNPSAERIEGSKLASDGAGNSLPFSSSSDLCERQFRSWRTRYYCRFNSRLVESPKSCILLDCYDLQEKVSSYFGWSIMGSDNSVEMLAEVTRLKHSIESKKVHFAICDAGKNLQFSKMTLDSVRLSLALVLK